MLGIENIACNSGVYQLYIELSRSVEIIIGKLGSFVLKKGSYVYTGSAKRGLRARLSRHLSADKNSYWHIDYLLSDPSVIIKDIKTWPYEVGLECRLNQSLDGSHPVRKLGSGDCTRGCASHLVYLDER